MQWRHGQPSFVIFLRNIVYKIWIVGFPSISKVEDKRSAFWGRRDTKFQNQVTELRRSNQASRDDVKAAKHSSF